MLGVRQPAPRVGLGLPAGRRHRPAPAPQCRAAAGPRRVPRRDGDHGVPGAGRRRASARLVRRRARPARPVPRRLRDQVRAGPPGRACGPGPRGHGRRLRARAAGVPRGAGARRRVHDQRRGLGGRPSRPRRPGHRARRGVRDRRLVPFAAHRRRRAVPAGHPLRLLHGRFPGARLGARTRHRCRLPRRTGRAVARPGVHRGRRDRRRRRRRGPRRGRRGRGGGRLGPHRSAPARRGRAGRPRPRVGRESLPAVVAVPAPRQAPRAAVGAGRVRLPLVAPRRRRHARGRRRQPRPVRLRRPAAPRGRREELGVALRRRRPRRALPRPELPHIREASSKGWHGESQGHHHVCADRRR